MDAETVGLDAAVAVDQGDSLDTLVHNIDPLTQLMICTVLDECRLCQSYGAFWELDDV